MLFWSWTNCSKKYKKKANAGTRRRQSKKFWVRQWLLRRPLYGQYEKRMAEMKADDPASFKNFLRMEPQISLRYSAVQTRCKHGVCGSTTMSTQCKIHRRNRQQKLNMFNFFETLCGRLQIAAVPTRLSALKHGHLRKAAVVSATEHHVATAFSEKGVLPDASMSHCPWWPDRAETLKKHI